MRYVRYFCLGTALSAAWGGAALASGSSSNTKDTSVATATAVTQTSTQNVVRTISNAIAGSLTRAFSSGNLFRQDSGLKKTSLLVGDSSGLSAGDGASDVGTWGSLDYTKLRVVPDGDKVQRRLTDIYTGVAGADVILGDRLLAGVALSYARANTDGRNVNGRRVDQSSDSVTISPYMGYAPIDNLSIDGMIGYTHSFIETRNYAGTQRAVGSNNSNTVFGGINIGYAIPLSSMLAVRPFAGISAQYGKIEAYWDDQNNYVGGSVTPHWQARAGAKLMVGVTDSTQAFASAAYERDREIRAVSESSARLSLGTSSTLTSGMDFTLEGTANIGRETQQEYGVAANLRLIF